MFIGCSFRPLSAMEELELRRERLSELIDLGLVSPTLRQQITKSLAQLESQISVLKAQRIESLAA
jgi:hypothetical protein